MFHELLKKMTDAFKSNQVLVCSYKRRKYLLINMDDYWREVKLIRNKPDSIARYKANSYEYGDELVLVADEIDDLKHIGLAVSP
jgi:hypothetical protein